MATRSLAAATRSARCGTARRSSMTEARAHATSPPTPSSTSTTPTAPRPHGRRTSSSRAPTVSHCNRSPPAAMPTPSRVTTAATGTGRSAATPSTTPATCRTISAATESADLATAARPVLRAQRLLVRLAQRRQRDGVDEVDRLRRVDSALLRLDQLDQLVRLDSCVGAAYDDGLDRLAPLVVRHSDDADLRDSGVRADDVLHLAGEHVEAARYDHVLLAVDDRQEAGGVLAGDVTGVQPAALERFLGLLRLVPVALHHQRPAYADLARVAVGHLVEVVVEQRDLQPRHRTATGRQPGQVGRVVLV